MAQQRSMSPLGCAFLALILVAAFGAMGWVFWNGLVRPWRMTDAFFALAEAKDAASLRARITPDRRAGVSDQEIQTWIERVHGHSVATQRGYLHYPGSQDEAHFSITFMEYGGVWYVDSVFLGRRAVPR